MEQSKKISRKVISVLLSLLMVFSCFSGMGLTAFAAPTETLLTKITPTGISTYSESVPGVVTVTPSNISRYKSGWAYGGTVTVEPVDGYIITKCRFVQDDTALDDDMKPFIITLGQLRTGCSVDTSTGKKTERYMDGVSSVEVYGYQAATNNITINSAEHGSVTANPASAAAGTTVTLTAQPDEGYKLKNISACKGIVSDSFSYVQRQYNYYGTHFDLSVGNASYYWLIYGTERTLKVTSKSETTKIDRVVLEAYAIGGTIKADAGTVTKNGNTITVSDIDNTTVTIYSGDNNDNLFMSAEVYGKTADYGELTLTGTDDPNVFTFTMPDSAVSVSAEFEASVDKTALNNAITAAQTLYDSIKDNTDYSEIASTLKNAIDAAKEVADSETADQAAVDAAKTAITTAKTNAEAAKKDVDDTNAANAVITKINALPAADDVTTANKEAIEAARAAYNALTDDQKKKVDTDTLKKLTDAEAALQDAIDTEAAQGVTDTINALPDADKVTTADKEKIEAARKAYNDLTDDQKKKVSDDTLKKLTDAETALAAAEQKDADDTAAAQSATDTINNLPDADKVTTSDKEAIEAARAAYEALTDDQKAKVAPETLQKLVDDEAALKEAEDTAAAQAVTDEINALPDADKVTTSDKEAIEKARAAYDALTDEQKAKVSDDTLKKLADAETALAAAEKEAADEEAAKAVTDAINALPSSDKVATTDKEAIEKARAAYDALTDDQKAKVPAETLKKLTDDEAALAEAEKQEKLAAEVEAAKKNAKTAMNNQITVTQKGKKITVKWHKASQADGYLVYVQYCGKKFKKPVKTIKKNSTTKVTIKKLNGKKINLKKNFKVVVKPYKIVNGKKVVLAKSMTAHVVGVKNKKYTNVKKIKAVKKKLTVKVGKTKKAKAKVTLVDKKKKHIPSSHAPKFRYRTSDKSIATVNKKGKIKGIKKGTCTIYVYSINGKMTKIKVTVK